jgi:hypothetical protein
VDLRTRLARIEGVVESDSAYKTSLAYWVNGTEILHFENEAEVDIRLTRTAIRERRPQLRADHRVTLRASGSDWLTVRIFEPADEDFVVELAEAAAAAHRERGGGLAAAPPTGPDLARRRRWH